MKPEDRERLEDYVDDRMSAAQRSAFEARLADDPELAAALAWHRSMADDLREPAEPSPGFYTRARARFEAAQQDGRRRWPRLRWEVAGVAAALLLATAIFLPGILRQAPDLGPGAGAPRSVRRDSDLLADAPLATPESQTKKPAERAVPSATPPPSATLRQEAEPQFRMAEEQAQPSAQTPPAAPRRQSGAQPVGAKEDVLEREQKTEANAAGETLTDEEGAFAPSPAPLPEEADSVAPGRVRAAQDKRKEGFAPSPSPSPPPPPPPSDEARRSPAAALQKSGSVTPTFAAAPSGGQPFVVAELPPGLLGEGEKRIVDDPESWNALLRGDLAASAGLLGGYRDDRRLVLIGAGADGVRCATLRVQDGADGSVWLLVQRGGRAAGCAVRLADDGREVQVVWVGDE